MTSRLALFGITLVACVVPLIYATYTDHIWEDSFITLRHSENMLKGAGPVFNVGEKVHGFTSPINMLGLGACCWITGQTSYVATFWAYRIICIIAFAAGLALIARRLWEETPTHPLVCAGAFGLLYAFDLKMVAFTANGMETAFVLFFLSGAISRLAVADPSPWFCRGVYWGGLMWSRPDGCIYIVALALADLLFSPGMRRISLTSSVKSGLLCAILYGPWFAFAWWYYGSPIPQTVIAKGPAEITMTDRLLGISDFFLFMQNTKAIFFPIYGSFGNGQWLDNGVALWLLNTVTRAASIFCLVYWLFPVTDRLGRAASFCFLIIAAYFAFMAFPAPWYLPPAALLGMVVLCRGIVTLSDVALQNSHLRHLSLHPLAAAALALLIGGQMTLCALNALEMRIRQVEIEMGSRYTLGMWLREHGRPDESVYLEPLGYIGYFSEMHMIDWPGLVAPEVARLHRDKHIGQFQMIFELRPDWVVLRQRELEIFRPHLEALQREYELELMHDVSDRLKEYHFIPGRSYLNVDATFGIFRRRDLRPDDFKW